MAYFGAEVVKVKTLELVQWGWLGCDMVACHQKGWKVWLEAEAT